MFKHPTLKGRVVVPDHGGVTVKLGTMMNILNQADKTVEDLRKALEGN